MESVGFLRRYTCPVSAPIQLQCGRPSSKREIQILPAISRIPRHRHRLSISRSFRIIALLSFHEYRRPEITISNETRDPYRSAISSMNFAAEFRGKLNLDIFRILSVPISKPSHSRWPLVISTRNLNSSDRHPDSRVRSIENTTLTRLDTRVQYQQTSGRVLFLWHLTWTA